MWLLILNIYLVTAIIYSVRNIDKIEDWPDSIKALTFIPTIVGFIFAILLNFGYPYKKIGDIVSRPEVPLIQVEHSGIKYEGVEFLYPVENFTIPAVRPAEYKPVYKNFYGITLN